MAEYIDRVFGPEGLLAQKFDGQYETREGQIELARKINEAFSSGKHLIGEGPCGTGKSLAYSVPAVWHALRGRDYEDEATTGRVVIATGNIALQEQLTKKDLPFLQSVLPKPFRFMLLKGRNNFVCKDRVRENQAKGRLPGASLLDDSFPKPLRTLVDWIDGTDKIPATTTGDKSDFSSEPEAKHWNMVSVGSSDCKGKACKFYEDCFAERAREKADKADIVVTNFHMLFAHVKVKMASEGHAFVLPEFRYLIIDEAHDLADVARSFFGFDRGPTGIREMANILKEWGKHDESRELDDACTNFFDAIAEYRKQNHDCRLSPGTIAELYDFQRFSDAIRDFAIVCENKLDPQIQDCENCEGTGRENDSTCPWCDGAGKTRIELDKPQKERVSTLFARAQNIDHELVAASECIGAPGRVYYVEAPPGQPPKFCARKIDVAELISEELMAETYSTVLVSATMSENANFTFTKRETGLHLHKPIEVIAESPFDFRNQALLIVPDGPSPNAAEEFAAHCADSFEHVVDYFNGRTLGLFTSYRNMKAVAERLRPLVPDLLVQGELPRTVLRDQFKERPESVLLGTSSFWTGVDVPGDSLSAVVIDKLPFPHQGDPIVASITESDPNSFMNYSIPRAAIHLRQGVGRLVRSKSDLGVVVILDSRLREKRYGKRFLRSLPEMRMTRELSHISYFMADAKRWLQNKQ